MSARRATATGAAVSLAILSTVPLAWGGDTPARAEPKGTETMMSFLDNGQIRLGVDLTRGGAVTFLADCRDGENRINNWDWGRQVQMSFYSGPVPFQPPGTELAANWKALGWNPIQSGDHFRHGSRVLSHTNDGRTIEVRCVPMIWPLSNVPAECEFSCTYRLEGKVVRVTSRLENHRSDRTQYAARSQELPAVYTNGRWYKLVTYRGGHPFTGAPVTTVVDRDDGKGWPWRRFYSPECWAALVDEQDEGVGVCNPGIYEFSGGFAGKPKGQGGEHDSQTGYVSPLGWEILDHNITYEYSYALVVGSVKEIRDWATRHAKPPAAPAWVFKTDRQHWALKNGQDEGWPIQGELIVPRGKEGAALLSPVTWWKAESAGTLRIEAAGDRPVELQADIEPATEQEAEDRPQWGEGSKLPAKPMIGPVPIQLTGDGQYQGCSADLRKVAGYQGGMVRLRIRLPAGEGRIRVRSIGLFP